MKKILIALILLVSSFSLFSCDKEVVIESISVVEDTIPAEILDTEALDKLADIKIEVKKSDDSVETISLAKEMISESDLAKLAVAGEQMINVTYEGVSTIIIINIKQEPQAPEEPQYSYTANVVYPDGSAVTSGVKVQWCTETNCYAPVAVNNEGFAGIDLKDGKYIVHLEGIEDGYTYNPNAYVLDENNKHADIKLIKLAELSGAGTKENPYAVGINAYRLTFNNKGAANAQYFSFTPTEAGTYNIKSLAQDKLAINAIDPYIGYYNDSFDNSADVNGNTTTDINFNQVIEANANQTYYFAILVSSATKFDATFDIVIEKN